MFPSTTPSFTSPSSSQTLAAAGHTALHLAEEANIIAFSNKIGTGASTPTSGVALVGTGTGTSAWQQLPLSTGVSGTLGVANGGTGVTTSTGTGSNVQSTNPTISGANLTSSPTLTTPVISDFSSANHSHTNTAGGGTLNAANALQAGSVNYANLLATIFSGQVQSLSNTGTAGGTIKWINWGGIRVAWSTGMTSNSATWLTVNWAAVGWSGTPIVVGSAVGQGTASGGWVEFTSYTTGGSGSPDTNGCSFLTRYGSGTNSGNTPISFIAIGI